MEKKIIIYNQGNKVRYVNECILDKLAIAILKILLVTWQVVFQCDQDSFFLDSFYDKKFLRILLPSDSGLKTSDLRGFSKKDIQ